MALSAGRICIETTDADLLFWLLKHPAFPKASLVWDVGYPQIELRSVLHDVRLASLSIHGDHTGHPGLITATLTGQVSPS